jgi:hypothetical protein
LDLQFRCSRCGRRYPSKLEVTEQRTPDGNVEVVCRHCRSTSRCEVCGMVSEDRRKFSVRKVEGKWRVVCAKCLLGETQPGHPGQPGRPPGK